MRSLAQRPKDHTKEHLNGRFFCNYAASYSSGIAQVDRPFKSTLTDGETSGPGSSTFEDGDSISGPDDSTYSYVGTAVVNGETEAHDVILANGAASETYLDIPGRRAFDNHAEYLALYGTEHRTPEMPAPRITSQRLLPETVKTRLGIGAEMPEMAQSA